MNNSKYYLNLRSGYMAPVTLHCSYGDSGETITFYIMDGSGDADLSGASVSVHGTRRDGANFGPFACTVNGNAVSFKLQSSMTTVEGSGIAEFTISKDGATYGTCNFGILVEKSTFPNGIAYDTDPSVYQDILKYAQSYGASVYSQAVTASKNYTDTAVTQAVATEEQSRIANDNALSERISNLVVKAGGSNITEVVDARVNFAGTAQTALKSRLDLFLEYDVVGTITEA